MESMKGKSLCRKTWRDRNSLLEKDSGDDLEFAGDRISDFSSRRDVRLWTSSYSTIMSTLKEILTRRPTSAIIRLTVPTGAARPAPPVRPALGQYHLNLVAFCKNFNARTQKYKGDTPMAVFEFTVKSPAVTW